MSVTSRFFLPVLIAIAIASTFVNGQNRPVKPLPENASLAETRKWLIEAIPKYASYKTRVNSASVSNVKFEGCSLAMTIVRKTATAIQDVVGVTTRTHSSKQEITFDLSFVEPDGIGLADHIFPEFQTITVKFRSDASATPSQLSRDHEIIVKQEAGEAIRSALILARRHCTANP